MAKFVNPESSLTIETKKGMLELSTSEYLCIQEDNKEDKLIINKLGIQKIEDFFEIESDIPDIKQIWNSNNNFNIIVVINIKSKYGTSYGVSSGNPMNLKSYVSMAYATETTIKRARSTAILELLRKNHTGKDKLALLYSSFDEFNAENSINNPLPAKNETNNSTPKKNTINNSYTKDSTSISKDNSNENKDNLNIMKDKDNNDIDNNNEFSNILFTMKYPDGITLSDLFNTDKEYLKMLATKANKYRTYTNEYLKANNIELNSI